MWVSAAAYPGSVPDQTIDLARQGVVRSIICASLIDQIRRALLGPRIGTSPEVADIAEAEIRELSNIVVPTIRLAVITAEESDNRILECAVEGRADLIITGDRKHLLPLGSHAGILIMAPADFLQVRRPGERGSLSRPAPFLPEPLSASDPLEDF